MKRHNRLKTHTLGLAAALLMTAGMSQIALAGDSVYVNTSSLRYRTSAQIKDNNIAGNLSYGQKLERVGTSGQWTMILLNGKKYYVSSAYVTSKKPASAGAVQTTSQTAAGAQTSGGTAIALSSNYKYANYSKINSGTATLYRSTASNKKNKVVCVNAGHGTNGGKRQDPVSSGWKCESNRRHNRSRCYLSSGSFQRYDLCRWNSREQGNTCYGKGA